MQYTIPGIMRKFFGRRRLAINYDVDLIEANGYLVYNVRTVIHRRAVYERHEMPFQVARHYLIHGNLKMLAARILSEVSLEGHSPQYVLFWSDDHPIELTPELVAEGITLRDVTLKVFTQYGQVDTLEFLREQRKWLERAELLNEGPTPERFDFTCLTGKSSRFKDQNFAKEEPTKPSPPLFTVAVPPRRPAHAN